MKLIIAFLALTLPLAHAKKSGKPFWTDPEKAKKEDPDFSIQGEYGSDKPGAKVGVQVVALGDGNSTPTSSSTDSPASDGPATKNASRSRAKPTKALLLSPRRMESPLKLKTAK